MDVKSSFLNEFLKEEIYVKQINNILKLDKALCSVKQAPRAWHERLSKYLLDNDFVRVKIDNARFLKSRGRDLLIVQVYMDDIIFGAT